jgi:DNA-directed RNA polymerase subunit RPC12/RpoP
MKSYTCDHCGQSVQVQKLNAGQREVTEAMERKRGPMGKPPDWATVRVETGGGADTYEVCSSCHKELEHFLSKAQA